MYPNEFIYTVMNMWKKNISIFLSVLLLIAGELTYLVSLTAQENTKWYETIELHKMILYAILPILIICFIVFKRVHKDKAQRKRIGILLIVDNANEKTYRIFKEKFAIPFSKMVNQKNDLFDLVILDDYHSKILSKKIEKYTNREDKSKIVKILSEYNCKISINVDCINGGEGENLLCKLKMNVGFVHPQISEVAQKLLEKDMGIALEPVKNIKISKDHETDDFENYTRSVNYIFMFVFATVNLHCGCFEAAVKLFEEIYDGIASETTLINSLYLIKTSLPNRIGFCNAVMAQVNYNLYCENRDSKYLIAVRKCIDNVHCKKFNDKSLVVLRGICYFVIDKNIKAAEQCMNEASKNDPVIKFNKVFLKLYGNPSATNFLKSYHTYKYLNKLNQNSIEQIEGLVYEEYVTNEEKWQLLFLLFMIYDYQNNDQLAKKALILFCSNESAKQVLVTETFGSIIKAFEEKYKEIELSSDGEYSL